MKKALISYITLCMIVLFTGYIVVASYDETCEKVDNVAVNDVTSVAKRNWGNPEPIINRAKQYGFTIALLDAKGKLLTKTGSVSESLSAAIRNRDIGVTLSENNIIMGYIIFSDNHDSLLANYRERLHVLFLLIEIVMLFITFVYVFYFYHHVIKPFDRLKSFAARVAQGNLDVPLTMDRNNVFGAFTESFDIMREELAASRERERKANQSKKELVASLSHDIRTPVASIRSATELLQVTCDNKKTMMKLEGIEQKAEQIELLINNLFQATLEEMEQLEITLKDEDSDVIRDLILLADYLNYVQEFEIPICVIRCDKLRMGQIINNIISNSYKYADTPITVQSVIHDGFLSVAIADCGEGLGEEEVAKCCEKFFRGNNAAGKSGSGLGLYICAYMIEKMGGAIEVESKKGFRVTLEIPLS